MDMKVHNLSLSVGAVDVDGLASSSLVLAGDAEIITCSSIFDTPSDSLVIGPLVPLAPEEDFGAGDV